MAWASIIYTHKKIVQNIVQNVCQWAYNNAWFPYLSGVPVN